MASNLGDAEVTKFYRKHLDGVAPENRSSAPYPVLAEQLKNRFPSSLAELRWLVAMRNIAPFFPFDQKERAVVAHKFLMELVDEVRQPIDTTAPALLASWPHSSQYQE